MTDLKDSEIRNYQITRLPPVKAESNPYIPMFTERVVFLNAQIHVSSVIFDGLATPLGSIEAQ